jgi:hypothetical protein
MIVHSSFFRRSPFFVALDTFSTKLLYKQGLGSYPYDRTPNWPTLVRCDTTSHTPPSHIILVFSGIRLTESPQIGGQSVVDPTQPKSIAPTMIRTMMGRMLASTTAATTTKTIITTRATRRRGGCFGGAVLQLLLSCCPAICRSP